MPLEPLKFNVNWNEGNHVSKSNFDEIADKTAAHAFRNDNNLKQIALDLSSTYDYNNNGVKTQSIPIIDRLNQLDTYGPVVGTRNIALNLADLTKVAIFGYDGTALSSSNPGYVTFNSTSNIGRLVTRQITSAQSITLTGAHWSYDTYGDLSGHKLWVAFADTGSSAVLVVMDQGGLQYISSANVVTSAASATTRAKVLAASSIGADSNVTYLGWIKAAFDDTGNPGGENYWTLANSVGSVNIGPVVTYAEGEFAF